MVDEAREKPNFPTKHPYPEHFWHDALGCHWCHRGTGSMVSGHDGACPVPHLAALEADNKKLREGIAYYLEQSHLFSLNKDYDKTAPEKLEALIWYAVQAVTSGWTCKTTP